MYERVVKCSQEILKGKIKRKTGMDDLKSD
jgi:hypothetical protein